MNGLLLDAVYDGSVERTLAVISSGANIEERTSKGLTPLVVAAGLGNSRLVRTLLNKGADASLVVDSGVTALHFSAEKGYLTVTKLLVKAGADLEAKSPLTGFTPLHNAAELGHSEVMGVLIEEGANPNSRALYGTTPLYMTAQNGHVAATKVLLRAKANPLLAYSARSGDKHFPLDVAARNGHLKVADELIQDYGIDGCGGPSSGGDALKWAAEQQHVEVLGMLTNHGVVDTGSVLIAATAGGRESSVKFLLQQQEKWKASGQRAGYLGAVTELGETPLICSIHACVSPRITRLLVDAGADTTTAVRVEQEGRVSFNGTPLALTNWLLSEEIVGDKNATESQLHTLQATRRLLLRVEAVHAVSWTWARGAPSTTNAAAEGLDGATLTTPTPLISMLPVLRRRTGRPRVLLAALFRHAGKPY